MVLFVIQLAFVVVVAFAFAVVLVVVLVVIAVVPPNIELVIALLDFAHLYYHLIFQHLPALG